MTKPKVLVLLATYNGAQWVEEQLNSILLQKDVNVSIMVRDDASTDDTLAVLNAFAMKESRITVHTAGRSSGTAGRNFRHLFRLANLDGYDAVAFADQDDVWFPDKLKRAMCALGQSGAEAYSCSVQAQWADGRKKKLMQHPHPRPLDYLFEAAGQGCTYVVRVSVFQQISRACSTHPDLLDRLHYHDWLTYVLVRVRGGQWFFDAEPCMMYRQHLSNDLGSRGTLKAVTKRLGLIRNGWYRQQMAAALAIACEFSPKSSLLSRFENVFQLAPSWGRRFGLAYLFFLFGRRRLKDRCVMVVSALLGWV